MMKDITLGEYKDLRKKMNDSIRDAVESFEESTGMCVESVRVSRQFVGKDESGKYKHRLVVKAEIDI